MKTERCHVSLVRPGGPVRGPSGWWTGIYVKQRPPTRCAAPFRPGWFLSVRGSPRATAFGVWSLARRPCCVVASTFVSFVEKRDRGLRPASSTRTRRSRRLRSCLTPRVSSPMSQWSGIGVTANSAMHGVSTTGRKPRCPVGCTESGAGVEADRVFTDETVRLSKTIRPGLLAMLDYTLNRRPRRYCRRLPRSTASAVSSRSHAELGDRRITLWGLKK